VRAVCNVSSQSLLRDVLGIVPLYREIPFNNMSWSTLRVGSRGEVVLCMVESILNGPVPKAEGLNGLCHRAADVCGRMLAIKI
jgi:hypothetical protein